MVIGRGAEGGSFIHDRDLCAGRVSGNKSEINGRHHYVTDEIGILNVMPIELARQNSTPHPVGRHIQGAFIAS